MATVGDRYQPNGAREWCTPHLNCDSGDAQAGWLGAVPCDSGKALTRRWANEDRARPPRWRAGAETALPRRGRLVWRSARDSTENIIHDAIAEFSRLHLSCPIRPWNVPGVHVDAVGASPGDRVGGAVKVYYLRPVEDVKSTAQLRVRP